MSVRTPSASQHPSESSSSAGGKTSRGAWLALTAALLGWLFDGAEMGVFSLVGRPALKDLFVANGVQDFKESDIASWLGVITALFLIGAATGGVLFGWLGDRIGRVRAMTLSVLVYAVFTSLGGFAGTPFQLGLFRFIASLGMGGEWSLGVALVMEVFPSRSRAFTAGMIGAAANVGYLVVGFVGLGLNKIIEPLEKLMISLNLPNWLIANQTNQGWRIIMILGILPALLTFFIRMFVPESAKWEEEQQQGRTKHWESTDLLVVMLGLIGPVIMIYTYAYPDTFGITHGIGIRVMATILGVACAVFGYLFPVFNYLSRRREAGEKTLESSPIIKRMLLGACLSGVALLGTWGATQQSPAWANKLTEVPAKPATAEKNSLDSKGESNSKADSKSASNEKVTPTGEAKPNPDPVSKDTSVKPAPPKPTHANAKEYVLIWLSAGAVVGTIIAAYLGDWLGRRITYFLLCILSFVSVMILFHGNREYGPWLLASAFLAGTCTASFYGWLPLYLPELFSTGVRATGQGFAFNFGRVIAAVGTLQIGSFVNSFTSVTKVGPIELQPGYPTACSILALIYVFGMIIIWFAPETKGKPID